MKILICTLLWCCTTREAFQEFAYVKSLHQDVHAFQEFSYARFDRQGMHFENLHMQ
jgi:hypothetical protein